MRKMKELFDALEKWDLQVDFFIDTCFLFYIFDKHLEKEFVAFCKTHIVALSSFTIEEALFHRHDVSHVFRERFRHIVKDDLRLYRVSVPVHPGERDIEKLFISDFDKNLLQIVPDPSDAVLLVSAIEHNANILTRDKHHLFTTKLENYLADKGLKVYNSFPK